MRTSHIPFVNSAQDANLVTSYYNDSPIVRVSVDTKDSIIGTLPKNSRLWVDSCTDAFHHDWPLASSSLASLFSSMTGHEELASRSFQKKPKSGPVDSFVAEILDKCMEKKPDWLSVPQFPIAQDSNRNTLNRALARAAGKWRLSRGYQGEFVLPVIVTHDNQIHLKAKRTALLRQSGNCRDFSSAEGFWLVHCGLNDQSGSRTNEKMRFPDLISLHQELRDAVLGSGFVIGGPYWGMNLVLWARGLIEYPAIGVGSGFQYFIPGGTIMRANTRLMIPSLRRQALVSPALVTWLEETEAEDLKGTRTAVEFRELRKSCGQFTRNQELARKQIARSYHEWIEMLENAPEGGRALALYQDLSTAYVVGKGLSKHLPRDQKVTRPERIAQQLMMSCL